MKHVDTAPKLEPARPDPLELELGRPAYMPRLPWRWILVFGGLLTLVVGGYQVREGQRADALRGRVLDTYDENLSALSSRYVSFRQRIERWTMEAAEGGDPTPFVDPRLRVSGLHSGDGIYLRLPLEQARSAEGIRDGALAMGQDALVRCLGIAPASARGLYATGDFLNPEWRDQVIATPDFMRLRVMDEQLARNVEVDVPVIASLLSAQYFLLVIEQGENRRDAPVDVYLWDLREERQLLRTRVRAHGTLLPVRLRFAGAPSPPAPTERPDRGGSGAHDCSIASQIKAMTGEAPVSIAHGAELDALRAPSQDPAVEAPASP